VPGQDGTTFYAGDQFGGGIIRRGTATRMTSFGSTAWSRASAAGSSMAATVARDWKERFGPAFDAELTAWITDLRTGRLTGPSSRELTMKIALDPYMLRALPMTAMVRTVADIGYTHLELSPRAEFMPFFEGTGRLNTGRTAGCAEAARGRWTVRGQAITQR